MSVLNAAQARACTGLNMASHRGEQFFSALRGEKRLISSWRYWLIFLSAQA